MVRLSCQVLLFSFLITLLAIILSAQFLSLPLFPSPSDPYDTSPVSLTAYLTGHVWAKTGIADERFRSMKSSAIYNLIQRIRSFSIGRDEDVTENLLLVRHQIIDRLLHSLIQEEGVNHVVELAAGLSPRGVRFTRQYGQRITYYETDLPKILSEKKAIIRQDLNENYQIYSINALRPEGNDSIPNFLSKICEDPAARVAVISEGLVMYFNESNMLDVWKRISTSLKKCSHGGTYLSDFIIIDSDSDQHFHRMINQTSSIFRWLTRREFSLPYSSNQELERALFNSEFKDVQLFRGNEFDPKMEGSNGPGSKYLTIIQAKVQ